MLSKQLLAISARHGVPSRPRSPHGAGLRSPTAPAEGVLAASHAAPRASVSTGPRSRTDHKDYFRITGTRGHIRVEAATQPTLLYGVNWYLKYVAHLQVSPNGLQLGAANLVLPAPQTPIEKPALYPWRYALNENVDGYSAPYWDEKRWQHEIDILALSGTNAILIERGMDLVLYQTFRDSGYSDEAIRNWIVQPAHQNWQLMGNMCCFEGPISTRASREEFGVGKETDRHVAQPRHHSRLARILRHRPRGLRHPQPRSSRHHSGRLERLHPPRLARSSRPYFDKLAESFYRHQHALYGDSAIYDMEIFQEGGAAGDVPVPEAAKKVQQALMRAHPGALWMMLGWQQNPTQELLSSIDTSHVLIAEIEQGRIPREDRDREFRGASWLYGGLWEFGGRTTMGAPLYDYAVRLPQMAKRPGQPHRRHRTLHRGPRHQPLRL